MVSGFESFQKAFSGLEDCYTIIGGTACDLIMNEAGVPFRATRDVDMVLLIENRFEEFTSVFWNYIKAGAYRCGWKNSKEPHFYRFTGPKSDDFPQMIELFSRKPGFQINQPNIHLSPLPVSDEISSLSAILLNDDYYSLLRSGRKVVEGVSVLRAEYLVLFKAKAWLDLYQKKGEGEHVDSRDLRKHKNDILRLFAIIDPETQIDLPEFVANDINLFLRMLSNKKIDLKQFDIGNISLSEIIDTYRKIYGCCFD